MDKLVCLKDFEIAGAANLGKNARDYFTSGADDEITAKENNSAYSRIAIRPRVLRDVSIRDLSTTVLGKPVGVPLGVSPCAFHGLAHPHAECGSAKAVEDIGGIFILSVFATTSYEEIASAAPNCRRWCQFYMHKDRSVTKALIERAAKAGFEAICVTVDAQYVGNRRSSRRDPLNFPSHLKLPNALPGNKMAELDLFALHDVMDHGVTWEAISWLKSVTKLPVVVKGIQTAEDAKIAVKMGADGVFISTHGGRQIDTVRPAIEILPEVVKAIGEKCDIYIDGGIRRGTDVFKALALGAKMVFVGRPIIWGLATNGSEGAKKVMKILRDELDLTMALSGVARVSDIKSSLIQQNLHSNL